MLTLDTRRSEIAWVWLPSLKKESIASAVQERKLTSAEGIVWDVATGRRAKLIREFGVRLVRQPLCAPGLNPAEWVFEDIRWEIAGWVYWMVQRKIERVEQVLRHIAADLRRVQRLDGWMWIRQALEQLPP